MESIDLSSGSGSPAVGTAAAAAPATATPLNEGAPTAAVEAAAAANAPIPRLDLRTVSHTVAQTRSLPGAGLLCPFLGGHNPSGGWVQSLLL